MERWRKLGRFVSDWFGEKPPRVVLGVPPDSNTSLVVDIPLGDGARTRGADARLTGAEDLDRVRRVVGFCRRRRLPVGVWLVRGLAAVPTRPDRLARWLADLSRRAGSATVWLDPAHLSPHLRRRLCGNLRRFGCRVDEPEP